MSAESTGNNHAEGLFAGKWAVVTGAGSGIGKASATALLSGGANVVLVDRDASATHALVDAWPANAFSLALDLLDPASCASLVPRALGLAPRIDVLHANAGTYLGGDLLDAEADAIDAMLQLNVNTVMKNVRDVLAHMVPNGTGDIVVTSSLAAHYPTPWEPIYASSKWAIHCFVQTVRRQYFKHGIRVGSISPGPVATGLLSDWPEDKLAEAKAAGSLMEPAEVAETIMFMLTRPRHITIRDVVMMPTNFDL